MAAILYEQHRQLQAVTDDYLALLRETARPAADQVNQLRVQIARHSRQHRMAEEELVYAPFRMANGHQQLPQVQRHIQAMQTQWLAYSQHVRCWTPRTIAEDWGGYVDAVAERVSALRQLRDFEEREVYAPVIEFLAGRGLASNAA